MVIETDIAIAGGGCGGTAAAIQAARLGARVVLIEETPWLGGMLTSAGVVAFDGNWGTLMCGFYREIVKEIELYYGGPAKTKPGWVTQTTFEPRVLAGMFREKVEREKGIQLFLEASATELLRDGDRITGFRFKDKDGNEQEVRARVTIDATEYADLIELGGIEHRFGRESKEQTGEPDAPDTPDLEIQDVTYVAILKDYMKTEGRLAPEAPTTPDYNPLDFKGSTGVDMDDPANHDHLMHSWETFIDYGKLPNRKFMINWPFHANDFPDALACFDRQNREDAYRRARAHTLNFIRYIQTVLGHPELGITDDEYPTPDGLPFMPYVRETRRVVGDIIMREQDVLPSEGNGTRPPLHKNAIAVGDYFLDHHHARAHPGPEQVITENYPSIGKFQVPFGVFFPKGLQGMMAAEKSISVTHIINGCTRLQPIVMLMGQAAGAAAAMAVKAGIEPREVPLRDLQEILLLRSVMLYPYDDLSTEDRAFLEAQKLALAGVVFDNEDFEYRKDRPVTWDQVAELLVKAQGGSVLPDETGRAAYRESLRQWARDVQDFPVDFSDSAAFGRQVTRVELAPILCRALDLPPVEKVAIGFVDMPQSHWSVRWIEPLYRLEIYDGIWHRDFKPDSTVPRHELALMIDRAFDPFRRLPF